MNKKQIICLWAFLMALSVHSQTMEQAWKECARIEKQIKETSFPDRSFLITDFGARKNTPYEPCHEAINQAILSCCLSGGGRVVVPAGEFYVGPIILKSNVNLHLEKGAKLKFIPKQSLYFPAVLTRWEGIDCYNAHPLIYANGETNIAITGKGVIDGQASNETWWHMSGHPRFGWKEGMTSQKKGGRDRLFHLAENFEPFWIIHPVFCENLIVRRARMVSRGPNTDGCDPESTKNVLIEGCYFDTGDDCIAIKSGRNADGRKWNIPSENIIVRNCHMKDGHGGVVVGSEISGGFKNLFIENCTMDSPEQDRAIRIKSNTCRGGIVENIYARNIKVGECKDAILRINLKYESDENCNRAYDPIVKNVYIENVTSQKSKYGVFIDGLDDRINIYNVNLDNCRFENVKNGNYLYKCKDVRFNNLFVNGEQIKD